VTFLSGTVNRLRAGRPGFDCRQRQGFFFSSPLRSDRIWGPLRLLSIGYRW